MKHIDYGLGVLDARAFAGVPSDASTDLTSVYQSLLRLDELAGYEVSERFYEIGSLTGLEETRHFVAGKQVAR